ncbi:hypothetical protein KAFR_0A03560 [Kazachstania africana CBS 2517]|uniref:GTP-binding protein YPT52 n=1 Tax=Kazachstania africana (strain ATCC 22294 / BCRC 22015 / CBS 2517 / CECT 1963 / NBRC 1671 / NRRL Y-8276) TaxID=1071382 RepID=H2AN41_KAZAF|nr:hypothetical protein KAFR_0A03560 [Kazachstania africana CBS 2517]CCF55791.1 hypothetical protein KAFR_0A03560 [Kazachstania africana CBS 2517]
MLQFKLVLLGDSSVGKSSIVNRFVKDSFEDLRESTIGAAFLSQTIKLNDNGKEVIVKFEIWDTAGQERYKSLAPMYYRNANAALVVYDITELDSLNKAKTWVEELKNKVGDDNIVIYLVGNKLDVCEKDSSKRLVSLEGAKEYAKEQGLLFIETSAKTGANIKETFQEIGEKLYDIKKTEVNTDLDGNTGEIEISKPSTNDTTSCCS